MFTDKLYDHKFDIDDIILALCGNNHNGRWLLNTYTGELIAEEQNAETSSISDGDENNHWHVIEALPNSFINEMLTCAEYRRLEETEQSDISSLLTNVEECHKLPSLFTAELAGGWIREQVKKCAIEWIDMRGILPPSMKHVTDIPSLPNVNASTSQATSVKIQFD